MYRKKRKPVLFSQNDRPFLMIETTAYFEAYRYVLDGLKELEEDNLPFQRLNQCFFCFEFYVLRSNIQSRFFLFDLFDNNHRVLKRHQHVPPLFALQLFLDCSTLFRPQKRSNGKVFFLFPADYTFICRCLFGEISSS